MFPGVTEGLVVGCDGLGGSTTNSGFNPSSVIVKSLTTTVPLQFASFSVIISLTLFPAKKLARVAKVKAKNNKAKTVKVTWKKVANAKKYEVKVGNKTYTAKKATLTVKKLKKGKTYKIKVRAKATGFKTGAWSKTVKVKIKK